LKFITRDKITGGWSAQTLSLIRQRSQADLFHRPEKHHGQTGNVTNTGLAVDAAGNVFVTGTLQ
jgi:hypothetical protein